MNGTPILVGKGNNLSTFWLDGDQNACDDVIMSTEEITIQNQKVISSLCKGEWQRPLKIKIFQNFDFLGAFPLPILIKKQVIF